ncbi:MAG: cadherin-like domain-containing protein [candidate division KSB1 bacterium]|nr:cadherin-like domain-containing protein [candidate division KSB1 bacterium]MDZ7276646.1 cadherin-like domain-containing protein [candidate division KSB1 bacterium]MDZ7288256.1 cadherin-like domain-containing protein [candidate division KSB1 bacterium]MDZ7300482.1 cadherin-like domain-containing protein [candidate division KSB1 bacterium]MDZ7351481.1 cadherin-like domain-containing protein [candidate division KSB1 bacterium]
MRQKRLRRYVLHGFLIFLSAAASAQEVKVWTGSVSRAWSDAGNWLPAGQPQAINIVVIKKAANGNHPILDDDASVASLTIDLGASLTVNGHTLTVAGDFKVGTSGIAIDHLIMSHADDEIIVNGNAFFAARTRLEAGRLVLRGNLVQEAVNIALQPAGTVIIFAGAAPQTVHFQRPGTNNQSFLRDVIVRNPAGVTFLSNVHVTGLLQLQEGGRLLQADSVATYFHQQLPLTTAGDYRVRNTLVASPIVMDGDRALPHPENDLTILSRQALALNSHKLLVGGTLTVKAYNDHKHLILAQAADVLEIGGAAIFEGYSTLTAGTIIVRGDLKQRVSSAALQPAGTVFVLAGTQTQTVSFERPGVLNRSFLQDVIIRNPAGVRFATDVYLTGRLTVAAGRVMQEAGQGTYYVSALPNLAGGEYAISNSYVAGALALDADLSLPAAGSHLTILPRCSLTLNGHTLRVGGNFTVRVFEEYKHLFMTQTTDTLEINGDAEFQGQSELTAGVIIIRGDILQKVSSKSLQPAGTHFLLAGRAPQSVFFEKPGTGNRSHFKDLTVRNAAGVTFVSDIYITGRLVLEAGGSLQQAAGFSTNYTGALPRITGGTYAVHNTNIAGALVMEQDLLLALPVNNVTILPRQSLTLNGHTLEIGGNFKAGVFSAEKHLIMSNPADRLIVNGDATFEGLNVLQAGSIVLRGNLMQAVSAAALQPEGTVFVFDGSKPQIISFERPGTGTRSYLREVTIARGASVRAISDVFITGGINNFGKFEVLETRSLFLGGAVGVNHAGGTLVGNGTVNTPAKSFTNEGVVRPGASPGIMRIAGSYEQKPAGKLLIEIGGLQAGTQYSRLVVTHNAILDGTLELELTPAYRASVGDSFRVMEYGSASGQFSQVISNPPRNIEFHVRYRPTGVDVFAVAAANRAPLARPDSITTRMNTPVTVAILRNDFDANDDALRVTALDLANTLGQARIIGDSSIIYTPPRNFHGRDSLGYTVEDGRGGSSTARVYVTVMAVNRQPVVAGTIPNVALQENGDATVLFDKLHTVFADPDGDVLTLSASAGPGLTVWITGDSLWGKPQQDFSGPVEIIVTARDNSNAVALTSFIVNVIGANKPPAAFKLLQPQDGAVINPLAPVMMRWQPAADANGDSLVYSVRIFNAVTDTTIAGLKAPELRFNGRDFLRGATTYHWLVYARDAEFTTASADTFRFTTAAVTAVENQTGQTPTTFALEQNYPNPFNPSTTIGFALPQANDMSLAIFNSNGQLVKRLVAGRMPAGRHSVVWDGTNDQGERVATGMYLYVIKAGSFTAQRKLVLAK